MKVVYSDTILAKIELQICPSVLWVFIGWSYDDMDCSRMLDDKQLSEN